jgi:VWFA-related protein
MISLLLAATLVSLSAVRQDRRPLEFPADVRMIRLDVSVVDGRGRPVPGLTAEQFSVTEDGRPVELSLFEAIDLDAPAEGKEAAAVESLAGRASLPPRRVLLLVDTAPMSHGQLRRARDSAARYLQSAAPGEWVRLANLSTGEAWEGEIPADRAHLEAAARSLRKSGSPWTQVERFTDPVEERVEIESGPVSEAETSGRFLSAFAQGAGLLGSLESLLVQLEAVSGRKALVLISPGFPSLRGLDARLEGVASLARQSATAIYFIDAVGLDGLAPERFTRLKPAFESAWLRSGGAQDLAEATGGFVSRFANTLAPALARVAGEMRTYYVVGYVPARPDDGRFREVKVKVRAPGATARTKKGYVAGRLGPTRR